MESEFKPTHKVVKLEPGILVFSVGVLLQHIVADYYKTEYGSIKAVDGKYLEALK